MRQCLEAHLAPAFAVYRATSTVTSVYVGNPPSSWCGNWSITQARAMGSFCIISGWLYIIIDDSVSDPK